MIFVFLLFAGKSRKKDGEMNPVHGTAPIMPPPLIVPTTRKVEVFNPPPHSPPFFVASFISPLPPPPFFRSLGQIPAPISSNSSAKEEDCFAAMAATSPLTFILVNSSTSDDGVEIMAPNAFELDEQGEIARPEMLPSDWIELILLALLLLFGLPLNAIALSKQLGGSSALFHPRKGARISRQEVTRTNFLWLKLHLTVVDLLVILCYCPSHIAWLIGYTWSAGEFLCKAMQYSWDFCFHLMSFGVVSIALDRLRTVYGLMRMEKTGKMAGGASRQIRFVKSLIFLLFQRLILICYLGAALVSIPQFFVWTTIDLRNWSQCTTRWHKQRAIEYLKGREFTESFAGERIYTLVHLLTVFWLPFLIILSAYIYIVLFLCFYSLRPCTAHPSSSTTRSSCDQQQIIPPNNCQPPMPPNDSSQMNCPLLNNNAEKGGGMLAPKNVAPSENSSCWPSTTVASSSPLSPSSSAHTNTSSLGGQLPQNNNKKYNVPAWRLEMRSRIFQTTIHVIAAYLVCWLPYNVLALATFFSRDLQITISVHLELLRICVLLNTLLNPFIYGFKKGQP